MKFNWDNFTEIDFANYCAKMENGFWDHESGFDKYINDDYIGCVRVGDLCFDIMVFFDEKSKPVFGYTLFSGGVDTGYGYANPNKWNEELYNEADDYPYDCVENGSFEDTCISMTYEDFQKYAEKEFENFIYKMDKTYDLEFLVAKANQELHVW